MAAKKNNHFIPRFMLNAWARTNDLGRFGVDYYDIERSKYLFSEGTGKKAYSFAIVNDGYVPVIGDQRRTNLEDWFSGLEGTLANAIRKFMLNDINYLGDKETYTKFMLAVLSFKFRTQAFVKYCEAFLKSNPDIRQFHDPEKPIGLIVLENVVNATCEALAQYGHCDFQIITAREDKFITGDMPFVENAMDGWDWLILSNKMMLMIRGNNLNHPRIDFLPVTDVLVNLVNQQNAWQARYWIVGDSASQLAKYKGNADNIRPLAIKYDPVTFLTHGFYFDDK